MKHLHISLLTALSLSHLAASQTTLEKIIVTTPNKTAQSLHNVTANIDVITADEIQERGYRVLSDALQTHPGFSFSRTGGIGQTTSIYLRGFSTNRTLVLIDGVRYNDPTSPSGAQYEHLQLQNIARIEIVKGPQSGIWGEDASGGVINIITKDAQKNGTTASIHAEYGSYNTQTYGIFTALKTDKFDLSLNLDRLSSDGFSAKTADGKKATDFEDDEYSNNSYDLKLGYNITDHDQLNGFYRYIDADTDFDGFDMNATKAANDPIAHSTSKEKFYGTNYRHSGENYSAKLYYQRSDFQRTSKVAPSAYSNGISHFDGSIDESGATLDYRLSPDLALGAGLDLKKFKHKNKINNDFTNKGIYLSVNDTVHEEIGDSILSAVVRYDNFDKFDNKTTYRLGFKHYAKDDKKLSYFANYGTGYNTPTLYQLYDAMTGNKALKPETTKGFDLGFNYHGFNATYFQNKITGMIDYLMTDPITYKGAYYNLGGKTTLKGYELSYKGSAEDLNLAYNFNYTYLKTKDQNEKELPRRPKNSANLSLDYYGIPQIHLGTLISYTGKRKKSPYDANPTQDYKAYTLVDLIAGYDFSPKLHLYTKIENALDKKYENIANYGVSERAYYVGFDYKIK